MPSSKEYLGFVLEQLSDLVGITYKSMMGAFLIYYRNKLVGGIYNDRFLVKPVKSAMEYMPQAVYCLPYKGAKEMLLVDNVDDKEYLCGLFEVIYDDLPMPNDKKSQISI